MWALDVTTHPEGPAMACDGRAGFHLVDTPRADIHTRVDLIESHLTAWT